MSGYEVVSAPSCQAGTQNTHVSFMVIIAYLRTICAVCVEGTRCTTPLPARWTGLGQNGRFRRAERI